MEKYFLPISINITNSKILIIGGGSSAWNKIKILKRFNAHLEVVALEVNNEIKNSGIPYRKKPYESSDLKGYLMLYSCTNNIELDRQIVNDAKAAGVLVNIHDKPDLCQFVSPAVYQFGHMTVAVGSNASDVHRSIRVRNEIQKAIELKIINHE